MAVSTPLALFFPIGSSAPGPSQSAPLTFGVIPKAMGKTNRLHNTKVGNPNLLNMSVLLSSLQVLSKEACSACHNFID
jgi:hypothetical protein